MGIIKAVVASASTMAADQWKEFYICNAIPDDQIMVRVYKHRSEGSSNNGDDNIITDGSIISVADGQCAIVVSNGKVISVFTEPGENEFRSGETFGIFSKSPAGALGRELGRRIAFGGDAPGLNQRVYYMNTKLIPGMEFGDGTEIPIRIRDEERGIDIDCTLVVSGLFSFRICDPARIYKRVIGNVRHVYEVAYLEDHMRSEVNSILMSAIGDISCETFRPYQLGSFIPEIEARIVDAANEKMREEIGIEIVSMAFNVFRLKDRDSGMIKEIQRAAVAKDPVMAAAILTGAQSDAMREAAANTSTGGAVGLGVVGSIAGSDNMPGEMPSGESSKNGKSGRKINFCPECGAAVTEGRFCRECGTPYDSILKPEQ
ncbi:MAG: SPFH domain-containing protein [Lachnospiraceae bacterium]|nr:SPFH domain-containing protein [Lachnospiraceae bacterium]